MGSIHGWSASTVNVQRLMNHFWVVIDLIDFLCWPPYAKTTAHTDKLIRLRIQVEVFSPLYRSLGHFERSARKSRSNEKAEQFKIMPQTIYPPHSTISAEQYPLDNISSGQNPLDKTPWQLPPGQSSVDQLSSTWQWLLVACRLCATVRYWTCAHHFIKIR